MKTIGLDLVRELIDFAPTEEVKKLGFAELQLEGTAAAYNMLARNRCAYIADEVGMGKTFVALGMMALLRYFNPDARMLVIAPRENIQRKWIKELQNFVHFNWKLEDNRVKSLQGGPVREPVRCESLMHFVRECLLNADRDLFLRMHSFSVATRERECQKRLRDSLLGEAAWLDRHAMPLGNPEEFRDHFGRALNMVIPEMDLVVVDEAHNLKHGFKAGGSTRNRVLGFAFGHPEGDASGVKGYGRRAKRVLFLSATPFEEEYGAIQREFDIFGFGQARLFGPQGEDPLHIADLVDPDVLEDRKREIAQRVMIRRVSHILIGGKRHTKNMYRREWRRGGYLTHDYPMHIEEPRHRLVIALMQKKVSEVLNQERFNNQFQIGMLSSFESFLQTVGTTGRRAPSPAASAEEGEEEGESTFHLGGQTEDREESWGVDTGAVNEIADSYRKTFRESLPHPKLDATSFALSGCFDTAEKTLVFVRRVATVQELADKLNEVFDVWIRKRMEMQMPEFQKDVNDLFRQYKEEGRARRREERIEDLSDVLEEPGDTGRSGPEEDKGSAESFFAWFFRGDGPKDILSGAAFQKNRLSSTASVYSTFFEDDYVSWLLGHPEKPLDAFAAALGQDPRDLPRKLRHRAYEHFLGRGAQKDGYPRLYVSEAYQVAALDMLEKTNGDLAAKARVVLQERYGDLASSPAAPPAAFPAPDGFIGASTFFTELVRHPELRDRIWPAETGGDFRRQFRRREQRRELLSALARLGVSYVDLYCLAIRLLGSLKPRKESDIERPAEQLARDFCALLEQQMQQKSALNAFFELSSAARAFDWILSTNFPMVQGAQLGELARTYTQTLQRQVPVGRMHGRVNRRLVQQFRMPGFPLVLVTTDVLQEGEDLHTFCRRVVHYGITWTPSAIEQRTGRIDRIGSLAQRRLEGRETAAAPDELIQVYYPYLRDTVEVLQVRRVLRRLNRFFQLIHRLRGGQEDAGRKIDTNTEFLDAIEDVPPVTCELESAFPVAEGWKRGELSAPNLVEPDIASRESHFEDLWKSLVHQRAIQECTSSVPRRKIGIYRLEGLSPAALLSGSPVAAGEKFSVSLRSKAGGDATLVRCESEARPVQRLRDDDEVLDRLYNLQRDLFQAKICVRRDEGKKRDTVTVEGDLLFVSGTTQVEELQTMVARTVVAAACIRKGLDDTDWEPPVGNGAAGVHGDEAALDQFLAKVSHAHAGGKRPLKLDGCEVSVDIARGSRQQKIRLDVRGALCSFSSIVLRARDVTKSTRYWNSLAYRAWLRNGVTDIVTFAFDDKDNLVGRIEQLLATLDATEVDFYLLTLARECDRFEFALTGEDRE